jgi:hypothetical protein
LLNFIKYTTSGSINFELIIASILFPLFIIPYHLSRKKTIKLVKDEFKTLFKAEQQ